MNKSILQVERAKENSVLMAECKEWAMKVGDDSGASFLFAVIERAKVLIQHAPEGTAMDEVLRMAFEQCMERERYLAFSDDRDAVIFRRMLCISVYHQIGAANELKGIDREMDRIAQEEQGEELIRLRTELENDELGGRLGYE
jgi:hypothetical protein